MQRWAIACLLAVSLAIPAMAKAGGNLSGTVLDNEYEYVSSGGYFGAGAGDVLAYPGAPFSLYATFGVHF